jgi:hypothetical protein
MEIEPVHRPFTKEASALFMADDFVCFLSTRATHIQSERYKKQRG